MNQEQELFQIVSQYLNQNYPEIWNKISLNIANNNDTEKLSEQELKDAIINGKWDELIEQLAAKFETKLDCNSIEIIKATFFKLIEQKIQETLENGNQTEALEILRNCLSPLKLFPDRIHKLAQDILLMRAAPINRNSLFQEIYEELKKVEGLILPANRLEELINEAREYQKIKCPFHVNHENGSSLWTDHKCITSCPLKLRPPDVRRREISISSRGELLNIFMSTNENNLFIIDDESDLYVYVIDDSAGNAKKMSSRNVMQSITFWPRISNKLPEKINREVFISNVLEDDEKRTRLTTENPISMALTADKEFIICSTEGQNTTIFDMNEGKVIHSWIRLRCSHLLSPQNPSDKYFLAVSDNGAILQISTESFETIKTIPSMNERLQISSAYLDGRRLLIGYSNSTLYYYEDWQNYEHPTRIFRGHICTKFRVNSILSRFNRNLALSCSENGSIYVWNIDTGRLVYEIGLHQKCSNDIMEIGQGQYLTCGDDGKLYEWKLK